MRRHHTDQPPHPPGLITAGLFSITRNPNYLGEAMIYAAYALLTKSRLAWGVLALFIGMTFVPNMVRACALWTVCASVVRLADPLSPPAKTGHAPDRSRRTSL